MGFFFFTNEIFLNLTVGAWVVVIEWLGGPLRTSIMSDEMLNLNHFSWNIPDNKTHKLMSTNKRPLKQKSAKETLPWGVTAQGVNASYKLHGRGMIVCKQKTKDKQLDSMLRLVTDVSTCFVGFLKGYHFFLFLFFALFFCSFSRSRYWDCWNVLGIHSTL